MHNGEKTLLLNLCKIVLPIWNVFLILTKHNFKKTTIKHNMRGPFFIPNGESLGGG